METKQQPEKARKEKKRYRKWTSFGMDPIQKKEILDR